MRIKASELLGRSQCELAEKTRSEPGNLLYAVYQSASDPQDIIIHEQYADDAAVDAHRPWEHYHRIVRALLKPNQEEE